MTRPRMSPLEELRHSAAHVMATAVLRLFPEAKLDIGPPTETGFYYDFDLNQQLTREDLDAIETEMRRIIDEDQRFECIPVGREEALTFFKESNQPYKIERLSDISESESATYYRNGEFIDLCAGTHLASTGQIKAFKLLSIAGAYYKGNEQNKQLQRIYGTAFPSHKALKHYLQKIEEAKKRDHRKLGKELALFHIDDTVGQGLVLWTPKGAIIRQELQTFILTYLQRQGYQQVFTPHVGKLDLYRTSGHFPYYKESQFSPMVDKEALQALASADTSCAVLCNQLDQGAIEGYLLKPMNCPLHIKIFDSQLASYRDLPIRLAEFGTVYRWEQSGELNGMTRVRGFTQDDAHIFCAEDQLNAEIMRCLDLVKQIFATLGIKEYRVRIGLCDPDASKYIGGTQAWDKAENALREATKALDVAYTEEPGEAAFYGPKIDFVVKDVIGREWQLGTIQVDYNLPERFDLSYTGSDNRPHRPVMIHRAPFGSLERFCGLLIEHFGGNFPTWLAPEQVRLLPLNDDLNAYATSLLDQIKEKNVRASLDDHSEKLGAKIRRAETDKIPYMLILGPKEQAAHSVSVRSRINKKNEGTYLFDTFIKKITAEIAQRTLPSA